METLWEQHEDLQYQKSLSRIQICYRHFFKSAHFFGENYQFGEINRDITPTLCMLKCNKLTLQNIINGKYKTTLLPVSSPYPKGHLSISQNWVISNVKWGSMWCVLKALILCRLLNPISQRKQVMVTNETYRKRLN